MLATSLIGRPQWINVGQPWKFFMYEARVSAALHDSTHALERWTEE